MLTSAWTGGDSDIRAHIIDLLSRYKANCEKLERYRDEELIQEWQPVLQTDASEANLVTSLSEWGEITDLPPLSLVLELEKTEFLTTLERLKIEVQLVRLLLLHIPNDEACLLNYRYYKGFTISKVCSVMFFSRSTFYRKHDETIDHLVLYYHSLYTRCHSPALSNEGSNDSKKIS